MSKFSIVLTDCDTVVANGDIDLSRLEALGEVTYWGLTPDELLVERVRGANAVICNKTRMTAAVMEQCPDLRYIGLFATGYNNIDTAYTAAHGITVCNAGQYSTMAVAQHTFALILDIFCSMDRYAAFTASGGWQKIKSFSGFSFPQHEIAGRTLGIVGYGSIGQAVAKIALAFGMKVLVSTRTPKDDPTVEPVSFDELLRRSDVISVHCPLTAQTEGMFDREAFAKCRDGAVFINTARGGVVIERDLREALESGKLAGAGIDVLTAEPMAEDCCLLGAPNLVITPHVAWSPYETRLRLMDIVEANLRNFLEGHPTNVVGV